MTTKMTNRFCHGIATGMLAMGVLLSQYAQASLQDSSTSKLMPTDWQMGFDDAFAACADNFYQAPPLLVGEQGQRLNQQLYALCFDGFATLYSGVSLTPFWSASHLTKQRVQTAHQLVRSDNFRPEHRLPVQAQAQLADYRRSGFDRGHVAPNGDMATTAQQYDSFSLANIAPQHTDHNRHLWRHIEIATRTLAVRHGEIYVVTGVAFLGKTSQRIGGRVMVPSHFFKAVYVPSIQQAGVYWSPNDATGNHQVISLSKLEQYTGIRVMPALPPSIQTHAYALPAPMNDKEAQAILLGKTGWLDLAWQMVQYLTKWLHQT